MKTTTKKPGWNAIRQQLATQEKPALLALVKELYDAAAVNRDLLHARFLVGTSDGELWKNIATRSRSSSFPPGALAN